jgi:hypothetical protein
MIKRLNILLETIIITVIEIDKLLSTLGLCFGDCGSFIISIGGHGIRKKLRRGNNPGSNSFTRSRSELHILSAGREGFKLFNKLNFVRIIIELMHLRL